MTTSGIAPSPRALRKGAELDLAFTDLLANGQGVGRADGIVVFCFGPLPGEVARVRITQVKARYAVAEQLAILRESPERARPFCPVFGACGGCQLQHLDYAAQLRWKRDVVRAALARIGGHERVDVRETIGLQQPRAYRNKMALVVDRRATPAALGFYRQRSHEVVPIDACPIVAPRLDEALGRLNAARRDEPVSAMLTDARHLVARSSAAAQQSVLTITSAHRSESAQQAAPLLMREIAGLAGVSNSFDLSSANAIVGKRERVLAGEPQIEETIGGLRYRFSAQSFFQVNVEMVARIFEYLAPRLTPPRRIVDLYSGVGTFSLLFARHGWNVVGVEENARAVAEANENARRNGLDRAARFMAGRIEQLTAEPDFLEALRSADVVFLDPPRKGCDERTLGALADARVRTLWYLSCDPATLARDSKFLTAKGYHLGTVAPFDMFPQTGHVETLAELEYR
ncbi:MAG: 23S rRNA (uracil(1939)-C(5))-methyltransferase RlmD [Candidatus Eremiobacteraeota bacterium]|nr:23S rRNA (uracil(1939)-C(5))-methyltransferase RlmD [Candidatus Eremiobacteraeota bacterium]